MGPSASAGRKFSAPTSRTIAITQAMNSGVCVGNVPSETGTRFFCRK